LPSSRMNALYLQVICAEMLEEVNKFQWLKPEKCSNALDTNHKNLRAK